MTIPDAHWQKSSFSEPEGNCVEAASAGGSIFMRESDEPAVVIKSSPEALSVLLRAVKAGRLGGPR